MKKIGIILIIGLLLLTTACTDKVVVDKYDYNIVMLISSLDNPFFLELSHFAEFEAKKENAKLYILDSQNSVDIEYENFNSFNIEDIDILILNPTDSEKSSELVKLANKHEIPVITVDREVKSGDVVSHIASDNYLGGFIAGEHLKKILDNKGNIMLLEGIVGTSANKDRVEGFKDSLKETEVKIAYKETADFNRKIAYDIIINNEELLKNIDAVFAVNDEMALGVLDATLELNQYMIIVGFDGNEDAISAVINGYLAGTVAQQPDLMANECIKAAKNILNNESVKSKILVKLKMISVGSHN